MYNNNYAAYSTMPTNLSGVLTRANACCLERICKKTYSTCMIDSHQLECDKLAGPNRHEFDV